MINNLSLLTPVPISDYVRFAEKKVKYCIENMLGAERDFLVTAVLLDEVDNTLKVEFVIPSDFGNKHFVWFFSGDQLAEADEY